jgi:hypothetical protein
MDLTRFYGMMPTAAFGNGQVNLGSMENTISEKHLLRCFSENNWGWSITEPQLQPLVVFNNTAVNNTTTRPGDPS